MAFLLWYVCLRVLAAACFSGYDSRMPVLMFQLWIWKQDVPTNVYGDADITKSQDAVITEISEQYVEEASTAEVGNRSAAAVKSVEYASVEPDNVQIAVGGIGDVPAAMHVPSHLERFSSLGQRDGYESREASNGTGLYGLDEKVEAGTKISTSSMGLVSMVPVFGNLLSSIHTTSKTFLTPYREALFLLKFRLCRHSCGFLSRLWLDFGCW